MDPAPQIQANNGFSTGVQEPRPGQEMTQGKYFECLIALK